MEIRDNIYTSSIGGVKKAGEIKRLETTAPAAAVKESAPVQAGDRVEITKGVEKKAEPESPPKVETTVAPKEEGLKNIPAYPRDLYKVADGGKDVKKVKFIYDPGGREVLKNLTLIGSWDKNTGKYANEWKNSGIPMEKMEDGRYQAAIAVLDDAPHDWSWGVTADGPSGKQQWAVFEEGNLKFNPSQEDKIFEYAPTNYHKMGAYKDGDNINFRYWAPNAKEVKVKAWDDDEKKAFYLPMERDEETGMWNCEVKDGWKNMKGMKYLYQLVTSEGMPKEQADPYARQRQGVQRGINVLYLHPKTGQQAHQFNYEDGKKAFMKMVRFEVQDQPKADSVYLRLFDDEGRPMSREMLEARLGKFDASLVSKFHDGKMNDFYSENMDDKGRIKLTKQGNAWAAIMHNADRVPGMKYQFEIYNKDENGQLQLVGDVDKDGNLSPEEAKAIPFNDPYSNQIDTRLGWERAGIITEPQQFEWKNDNAPRMTRDQNKFVIYQLHVGSVFGDAKNVQRSTFKDVMERLQYFKDMGVNTLELLPTNSNEGTRDWGYIGTNSFTQTDTYGFVDENGQWVSGPDALKRFVDEAHGMGFNVIDDVVYNHFGGEFNHVWESDGKKNPWFDWEGAKPTQPGMGLFKSVGSQPQADLKGVMKDAMPYSEAAGKLPQETSAKSTQGGGLFKATKDTPWGAMPAYNKKAVKDFVVNNGMMHMDELHFDGLRFDFTHPIHDQAFGGTDGWNMLRKLNREIHFFYPGAITSAEEFPNHPAITKPSYSDGKGGLGFNSMWNTEYQHRLVHSHYQAGIVQAAAHGWKPNIDHFMAGLTNPPGFDNWMNSVTVISNHDEVGNADRIINVAESHREFEFPSQWGRSASRFAFGVGMLSPGIPIFFQGTESIAKNRFSWGKPASWDLGWDWQNAAPNADWGKVNTNDRQLQLYDRLLSMPEDQRANDAQFKSLSNDDRKVFQYLASQKPEELGQAKYNVARKAHNEFCKDMISLRKSSPAFEGDAEINRVYTHEENGVMAFHRKKGGEEFLVFGSLNKNNMGNYNIPLMDGKWKLVFNSDDARYGGDGFGYGKQEVYGNAGSTFDLPAGGLLIYKKV